MAKKESLMVLVSLLTCLFLGGNVNEGYSKESADTSSVQEMQRVNINNASFEELQTVRGIGPVIAQRVVDFRTANGPFKALEDLAQVQGIGEVKYQKMREQLSL